MKNIRAIVFLVLVGLFIGCGSPVKIVKFDTKLVAPFKGDSVTLYWEIENAHEATLNGQPVSISSGFKRVLLDKSETYILKAVGTNSEATNKLEIVAQPK